MDVEACFVRRVDRACFVRMDIDRLRARMEAFDEGSEEEEEEDGESDVGDDELQRRAARQLDDADSDEAESDDGESGDDLDAVEEVSNTRQPPKRPVDDAHRPLGDRLARRATGAATDPSRMDKAESLARRYDGDAATIEKRSSKNAPVELSNKRPGRWNKRAPPVVVSTKRPQLADPRFDDKCGALRLNKFNEAYDWLDAHEDAEISREAKRLKREKRTTAATEAARAELNKTKQRRVERKRAERRDAIVTKVKREAQTKVAKGETPFYLKRAELKKQILEDQFAELKKAGKLNKFLVRKARKVKKTEAKSRPERRNAADH